MNRKYELPRVIASSMLVLLVLSPALSADPMSANYRIRWDALDSGGGTSSSTSYHLTSTIGPNAAGSSVSTNYALTGGFQSVPDIDSDTVRDFIDNCLLVANTSQFNANHGTGPGQDIFGNACDADLNEDGFVNLADLVLFKAAFGTADAEANLDGVGNVNLGDLVKFKQLFGAPPGPSGLPSP